MTLDRITFWTVLENAIKRIIKSDSITDREKILDLCENFDIHFVSEVEDWFQDGGGIEYEDDDELYGGLIKYGEENSNKYYTSMIDRLLNNAL